MATITDMPYELLYRIIYLLVQSSVGAADFARVISVCKKFSLFREDELLKLVNFDTKIELKNIYQYQHVNGLLVKCSEAGNVSARFLLGKVILVSSSQLLLREWQKAEYEHVYDDFELCDLECILVTNVQAQNCRVDSFMTYLLPKQVSTSGGSSQTRLVHYQLVRYFLLNGSHRDLAEMSAFLKSYLLLFTSVKLGSFFFWSINGLVLSANKIRYYENLLAANRGPGGCEGCSMVCSYNIDAAHRGFAEHRVQTLRMFETYWE